ncbi:MAG: UDP-N-acetylmuramate--L-alanine ligase [Anaerosomatales bacterium]|nr:UDP-N-acetylmuramate--L-alanine ligase [Anaerosomatales bacterium]
MSKVYAHFIGIGGAGMSALARVLVERGVPISGSDLKESRYAQALVDLGVPVTFGHAAENLGDPEVVVVSSAIPETNPELAEARRRGLPVWSRAEMLAHLGRGLKTLAVAGTHGKTTTSSMLATVLSSLGCDPTFLIGGELNDMGSNARSGSGEFYVVEADESDGSFVRLDPFVAVVTNIEADHLDHYGSLDEVVAAFGDFIAKTSPSGAVVVCGDDERLAAVARRRSRARVITYGASEGVDVHFRPLEQRGLGWSFEATFPDGTVVGCVTSVPGLHNVSNATAVLAATWALGLDVSGAAAALAGFSGVRRRFERVAEVEGIIVVDDYAHHPTEIRATLRAARQAAGARRIFAIFQPHRYTRTATLAREFGEAFGDADKVVLMDVYAAGEAPIPGVSGKSILDAVLEHDAHAQVAYFPHRADVAPYVAKRARPGDMVMTLGAGDVTVLARDVVRVLRGEEG